ncbi:Hypothetical protein FKW44_010297, partial [Caligus rogercresseyi]
TLVDCEMSKQEANATEFAIYWMPKSLRRTLPRLLASVRETVRRIQHARQSGLGTKRSPGK